MIIKPGYYYNNSTRNLEVGNLVLEPNTFISSTEPEFAKIEARVFGLLIHESKLLINLRNKFTQVGCDYVEPVVEDEVAVVTEVTPEPTVDPKELQPELIVPVEKTFIVEEPVTPPTIVAPVIEAPLPDPAIVPETNIIDPPAVEPIKESVVKKTVKTKK